MARDFFINGESLVRVKGKTDSAIANLSELGLAADPIRVTPVFKHRDISVDSWGEAAADVQWMLAEVQVTMNLIHLDRTVLDTCLYLSMGAPPAGLIGTTQRAGMRLGNNLPRFFPAPGGSDLRPGNCYIGLQITSPQGNKPWQFFFAYLMNPPMEFPLGVEKSIVPLNWRVIPYPTISTSIPAGSDPGGVNGGIPFGATNAALWSHTILDS